MNKLIHIFLLFLVCFEIACSENSPINEKEDTEINGNDDFEGSSEHENDQNNDVIPHIQKALKITSYNADGTEVSRTEYAYDSEKRLSAWAQYTSDIIQVEYTDYKYNELNVSYNYYRYENGLRIDTKRYEETHLNDSYMFPVVQTIYDEQNKEINKSEYMYDSLNRVINRKNYTLGNLLFEYKYGYDGLKEYCEVFDLENSIKTSDINATFLDDSFLCYTEYIILDKDMNESKTIYKYDDKKRVVEQSFFLNGTLVSRYTGYQYNGLEKSYKQYNYSNGDSIYIGKTTILFLE